ncbi:MFS family permease [Actinokineospora baliensis]|uniref:MFS transporter n=1 Tax=Actinokineospora baliensis TaxID=547056 RepID=UPI00195C1354|nr:MFS transporter [Actinokineospora baliensis]MBM7774735.1 MFS family permease [Actinokineospora baliensis]
MTRRDQRARIGVSVVFAVCGAAFATWAARVPEVQGQAGVDTGQLAVALFGLAAGSVVALALSGSVIVKVGSRTGALSGAVLLCACLPLAAFAAGPASLTCVLFLLGAGNSLLDVSMNAHAARVEAAYGRAVFAGFHAFWNVGGLVGAGAAAALAALRVPVSLHFAVAGAVLCGIGVVAVTTGFYTGPDHGQGGAALVLPGRALVPLGAIAFCGFLAEGTVNDWSAVYLTEVTGAPSGIASLGYFAFSTAMIAVRLVADRVAGVSGAVVLMRVAAVVAATGFGVTVLAGEPVLGIIGFAVVGLGVSAIVPLAWSTAAKTCPESPGQAISAVAACGYLGFLVGPVFIGGLAGAFGLSRALLAVVLFCAAVFALAPAVRGHDRVRSE